MKRRDFLAVGATAFTGAIAAPAIAQSAPELKWRCTSSFPESLDAIYGASTSFARRVAEITDNRFQIEVFGAGKIVQGLQALDVVSNDTVEMCHTASYYYVGKDPAFAIATAIPFGLNARQQHAWLYKGGGLELCNEFFSKFNVFALPCGNTGAQMGGWFRREIKTVADLQGLKMRIAGLAGEVMQRMGVVPQQLAATDIQPSLERGVIDAAEWVGPYDDQKLGFAQVAPYYYYPAWWEGSASLQIFVNLNRWNELPPSYKAALHAAAAESNQAMLAAYDVANPAALRKLAAAGAQLRPFSVEILEASFKAAEEVYAELTAANADFKTLYDSVRAYRSDASFWFQFSEGFFDRFMFALNQRKAI